MRRSTSEQPRAMRSATCSTAGRSLERCVRDIRHLLLPDDPVAATDAGPDENVVYLWDGSRREVAGGTSYGTPF
jgi:hypothetical protein